MLFFAIRSRHRLAKTNSLCYLLQALYSTNNHKKPVSALYVEVGKTVMEEKWVLSLEQMNGLKRR